MAAFVDMVKEKLEESELDGHPMLLTGTLKG
jgi:hypothetical protein